MGAITVGADVGGTRTLVAVARDGQEVARHEGPGAAVRPGRAMSSAATVARVVREALNRAGHLRGTVLVVGAAGAGREPERRGLRDALRVEDLADRLVVTTDVELALEGALGDGPGIVLLAGTGSIAVARLADGARARQGGHGWQLGDEGGGYAIGRAALQAAGRAHDGRGPATDLLAAVIQATRATDFDGLVRWSLTAEPTEVAALAKAVFARTDDPVAGAILDEAAQGLAGHVEALLGRFDGSGPVTVALGGGLLRQAPLRERVAARLAGLERARVADGPLDALAGAFRIAAREAP